MELLFKQAFVLAFSVLYALARLLALALYLYNAGPHAHGARGKEGQVRGKGHILPTVGYF